MKNSSQKENTSTEENEDLRQAFDLFDVKENGKIDPNEIKEIMKQLGFDTKNPIFLKLQRIQIRLNRKKMREFHFQNFLNL